ncbi:hypothetical protein JCM10450v2_007796 [Rhodotorula kratochvilovae]
MAAATLMPLLAQSFVDQASQTTFEMVRPAGGSGHVPSTPSPSRPMRSPKRVTPSPRARRMGVRESPRDKDGRPVTDIFSWSDQTLAERYQFVEEVGYGNWGSVWKVRPKLEGPDAKVQSVKLVHRSRNPTSSARVRALWTEFKCIRALRNAPHPNLIAFHAFVVSPSYGLIVMDFHPQLMPVALPESRAKVYFRQLLSAVEHLHAHGITHNDIKPSNILLSSKDLAAGTPVLIDFGFAQQYSLSAPDRFLSSLSWGTPEYLSPERAKGLVHDERLSDVFALGVTMYEIVVGRTPFEKSEDETFLNREQLEVYYERTTTGKFYGDYILSSEFDSLIRQMVDPSVQLRMQSCATALRHRFFAQSPPSSARSPGTPSSYSTPSRTGVGHSRVQTPVSTTSSAQKKPKHASPRKMPKHDPKAFAIFQDSGVPSPAQTAGSVSPFSPRPLALANRVGTSRSPAPETPPSKAAAAPAPAPVQPPQSLARSVKSPPPPSRIPVRRGDLASPTRPRGTPAGQKRFVSSPLTSPIRHGAVGGRPRVGSQPLLSGFKVVEPAEDENKPHAAATAADPPARSASLKSIKRKPPPAISELDYVPALPKSPSVVREDAEVPAGNSTGPAAAERREGSSSEEGPSAPVTPTDESAMFTSRSYTIEIGKAKLVDDGRDSPILSSELPRLRKSSKALASTLRKLSIKHVRRAPSAMSFAGLKQSLSGRRSSLTDSTYDIVEAEKLDDRNAVTLPLNLRTKTSNSAPSERARLASFSRRMQGVLDARKTVDPFMISPTSPLSASFSPTVLEPFSFNSTSSLSSSSPVSTTSPSKAIKISPPQRKSSLRAKSLADSLSSLASPLSSPSISQSEFKPGHRRIPTAIRNVPSVVLHESADDADFSESDYSRADTPAFERVASPPPPPRVVEPSRQLPTWVPEDLSSDEGSDADVDEPTIKLTGSPSRIKRKPSRTASIRTATKVSLTQTFQPSSTRSAPLAQASPSRPALLRNGTSESASGGVTVAGSSSGAASVSRPASPSLSALPFTNLHLRSDSQSTFNTLSSAASGTGRGAVKGLHKRSRSVLSFFSLMGGGGGHGDGKEGLRPSSRASNLSSLAWSTTSRVQGETVEEEADGRKKKKGGRLRKAMSRVFR